MTIQTTTNKISYTGNGVTTTFSYNFLISATSWLNVYINGVLQTLTTNYSVTGAGVSSGGNVVFVTAPANASAIVIARTNIPQTQLTDYTPNDPFPAETHEAALDKLTMLIQQASEASGRSIKFPAQDTNSSTLAAIATRAKKLLYFNSSGDLSYVGNQPNTVLGFDGAGDISYETLPSGSPGDSFLQSGSGAVSRTFQNKVRESITPEDFGATGDGTTDDTAFIQAALDSLPGVLTFHPGKTYKTGVLQVKANIFINCTGASFLGTGSGLFNCKVALGYLWLYGCRNVTWSAQTGTIGKQFFWNGDNAAGSTVFGATTAYPITDLRIHDNNIAASKIECFGLTTESRVCRNRWVHATGVAVAPAYLYIERGTTNDNAGPVWVEDNYLDVYPPAVNDAAIFKITGGITNATIKGNYLRNNRPTSAAQLNVFTGAHKMRLEGNTLVNTQLHRKQVKGSLAAAPTLYAYDYIAGNLFDFQDGFSNITAIYFIGALGTIMGNQFILRNTTTIGYAIQFDQSDVDIGFDTSSVVATIVAGNIFDLRGAYSTTVPILISPASIGSSGSRYLTGYGNILLGGSKFFQGGSQQYSALFGNVWGDSGGATGTGINGGLTNMVMGNVCDTQAPVMTGGHEGNLMNMSIPTLTAGATPSVANGNIFFVSSATNITDFADGHIGKRITMFAGATATTIVHGATIKLNGAADFVFDTFEDSLTLVKTTATRWNEVGRSSN